MWEDLWVKKDTRQSSPEDLVQRVRETVEED